MKFFYKFKLSHRLMAAFFILGLVPASVVSWIMLGNLKDTLQEETMAKLVSAREARANGLENLFHQMSGQIKTLSGNALIVEAMEDFREAFKNYGVQHTTKPSFDEVKKSLQDYYVNQFGATYKSNNGGKDADNPLDRLNMLSQNEILLQYEYISHNSNPLGEKHNLMKANENTDWSKIHERVHPTLKKYLETFGYYDIFLVEPATGHIVYSVFKELDFTTSLSTGPYAKTNFGHAFDMAMKATHADEAFVTDLEPYYPSYDAAAGFISSPIYKGDKAIGILIFQIPTDKIDNIMAVNRKWKENGFSDSAEVFAIGKDKIMRSVSRSFSEHHEEYLKNADSYGLAGEKLEYAKNKNTTVLAQTIDTEASNKALNGDSGTSIGESYYGEKVFSAFKPFKAMGLEWYILAEVKESEALHLGAIQSLLAIILGASALCILIFSWVTTNTLTKSLGQIVVRLRDSTEATRQSSISVKGTSEDVSQAATRQASAIQETVSTLNEITAMVDKSVEYARESADKSGVCEKVAFDGKKAVEEMSRSMDEIRTCNSDIAAAVESSNQEIGSIVSVIQQIADKTNVINDIVFQTKLLSFNASVEAARAGEHGKGFAVVAEEVGNLAAMSGQSANEIGGMLAESIQKVESIVKRTSTEIARLVDTGQAKVDSGVEVAKRCGQVLDEVVTNVSSVTKMMDEVSQAAKEQAEGVSNITVAMNDLDQSTHSNSNAAQQATDYAKSLEEESETLDLLVKRLQKEIYGGGEGPGTIRAENLSEKVIHLVSKGGDKKGNSERNMYSNAETSLLKKTASGEMLAGVPDYSDPDFEEL